MKIQDIKVIVSSLILFCTTNSYAAFVVCITGGSASGKTTVAKEVALTLSKKYKVSSLSQDMYFEPINQPKEHWLDSKTPYYDHPTALNFKKMSTDLKGIQKGERVFPPLFLFNGQPGEPDLSHPIENPEILIFEGIHVLHKEIVKSCDYTVFVSVSEDERIRRRVARDCDGGRKGANGEPWTKQDVLDLFKKVVKPAHDQFIEPLKDSADLVVVEKDTTAVQAQNIVDEVLKKLKDR